MLTSLARLLLFFLLSKTEKVHLRGGLSSTALRKGRHRLRVYVKKRLKQRERKDGQERTDYKHDRFRDGKKNTAPSWLL